MTIADYLASGGIRHALTQTAERAYGSLTPDQQRLAGRLFLHLVHAADDLPPSRATVELGELLNWSDDAEAVLATSGHHDASDANDCGKKMPCTSNVRSGERDLSHALAFDEAKVPVDLGERCKQSAVPRCCCDSSVPGHQNRSEVR